MQLELQVQCRQSIERYWSGMNTKAVGGIHYEQVDWWQASIQNTSAAFMTACLNTGNRGQKVELADKLSSRFTQHPNYCTENINY